MRRIPTTQLTVRWRRAARRLYRTLLPMRWRRVARRLYRTLLPACLRRRIALVLALRLPGLRGLGVGTVAWLAIKDFFVDDMATYAAALAFHLLLALFPFAIFLVALLNSLHLPGFFDWLLSQAGVALPAPMWEQVAQAVRQVSTHVRGGLLSAGIVGALWASSAGMRAVNVAYGVTESRPLWQRYGLSLAFTLGWTALVIGATAVLLSGPAALTALAAHAGLDRAVIAVWTWLRVPVALLVNTLAVALIYYVAYYVAPNIEQPFQLLTPGAVLTVLGWLSATLLFSAYVATVAHYTTTYGSIAAIVVLLLYFYISSLALLLGAEVNAVILHYAPQDQGSARAQAARARRAGRKPVSERRCPRSETLTHPSLKVRLAAVNALARCPDTAAVHALVPLLEDGVVPHGTVVMRRPPWRVLWCGGGAPN